MKIIILSYLILAVLSGCATSTRSEFTALSGKNVDTSNIKVTREMVKGNTRGEDCQNRVLGIGLNGDGNATLDQALDNALNSSHANLLLNAEVEHSWFNLLRPFYTQDCWRVNGVAHDTNK
ncbi:MAG: hypothetical protein Q7U23_08180 [Methylococcales bacterium]|nr:hypothetical protein [Methylococcales bacterium]